MNLTHVPDIKVRFHLRDNSSPLFAVLVVTTTVRMVAEASSW